MSAPKLRELVSEAEIDHLLATVENVVLYFTATWCGPCRQFKPQLEILAGEHPEFTIVAIYDDAVPSAMLRFNIGGYPTCLLFKNGHKVGELVRPVPRPKFLDFLSQHGLAA